ncbi:tripartite tricarboxylate transporter TctB family protein [Pseudomonas sp. GD03944]|uniref:tripartite tricarboxylate transporter TctB family protein n=1 Tax=Pseudomonas sp. GD03944 TaxID=2975409 RepID=UPI002446D364|nr:tripartite tricarboxylate transporter TctB family protein [Pseudomonas sp. GD03944]MDH1263982.1 tripartite tricarboxylate transporter TctB family protein [Pseudomonas sp. GD03944]
MKFSDIALGVFFTALGLGVLFSGQQMKVSPFFQYGAGFFPSIIGSLLALCGVILLVKGVRTAGASGFWLLQAGPWLRDRERLVNILLVPVLVVAFIALIETLGFIVSAILLVGILCQRFSGRPLVSWVTAVLATLFLYVFFQQVMSVQLPMGVLTDYTGS